jgi:hypothetical protein
MADSGISQYAIAVAESLARALGPTVPAGWIDEFVAAAQQLDAAAELASTTTAQWQAAVVRWEAARNRLKPYLVAYLLDGLPAIPGLDLLASTVEWDSIEGLTGELELGPLRLKLASASLLATPAVAPKPLVVGPFQPLGIEAAIAAPIGGGLPGGGSILRLPGGAGFGGTLNIPLGPVSVDASAILERGADGTPSFFALMGVSFLPPIQLSFGFSLDRVGGLVGVNRRVDTTALSLAIRTGEAGDTLFAITPPASPAALIQSLRRFFPQAPGNHIVGPTLKLAWLSMGSGRLVSLDLGVVIELPSCRVALLGVARASIPSAPGLLQLRLDLLGIVDPPQSQVSIDVSLVDSHALGIFSVFGDAAMRMNWGREAYSVLSIGGFYPGFNPEPARLPALRRVGMALEPPTPGISIRAEGYLAVTTNTMQLGGRLDVSISMGMRAHGFIEVNALVQFRPFYFVADFAAGFDVSVAGFSFGGIRLDGTISGPSPMVVRGKLSIDVLFFDFSWDETITIGSGQRDVATVTRPLLDIMADEVRLAGNYRAAATNDPAVVLEPRAGRPGVAAVPPTGALQWSQRRAPLGLLIDRVDGQPLAARQGVRIDTVGTRVNESFSPGSFCELTKAEKLSRPPFDVLEAGIVLTPGVGRAGNKVPDPREVEVVVILANQKLATLGMAAIHLGPVMGLAGASRRPPALGDNAALLSAVRESWRVIGSGARFENPTAAFQYARSIGSAALSAADAARPVDLGGI